MWGCNENVSGGSGMTRISMIFMFWLTDMILKVLN